MKINQQLTHWGPVSVAILSGMLAYYAAMTHLTQVERQMRESSDVLVNVVVAQDDLQPGSIIDLAMFASADVSEANLSQFAIRSADFQEFQGHVLNQRMSRGEPLLSHFVRGYAIQRFADLLSEDERAVSFDVDALNSHAYLVTTGDSIDIYMITESDDDGYCSGQTALVPVLERVLVIAVDSQPLLTRNQSAVAPVEAQYGTLTVAVSRSKAEKLLLARDSGKLVFQLRNKSDESYDAQSHCFSEIMISKNRQRSMGVMYLTPGHVENGQLKPQFLQPE